MMGQRQLVPPRGWLPAGGIHRLPAGFRSPGYPPRSPPAKALLLRCYFRLRGGFRPGWLPKNPTLSLAICRASPASIRISPGRNQDIKGLAVWTPTGSLAGPRKPVARPLPARSSPEYIGSLASWTRSVLASGVSQKIVSHTQSVLTASLHISARTSPPHNISFTEGVPSDMLPLCSDVRDQRQFNG